MKIYLICDVSRISGLLGGGNGLPPWYWFPELEKDDLRVKMAREINLAARAAVRSGATEILAHEACPVDMVSLDAEVKLIRGGSRLYLDKSFAGIAFIGQGIAKHVVSSNGIENNIRKIEFNGQAVDEMTICALYALALGVPTICASGESGCFKNLKRFMPGLICHKETERAMISGLEELSRVKHSNYSCFQPVGRTLATLRSQPSLRSTSRVSRAFPDGSVQPSQPEALLRRSRPGTPRPTCKATVQSLRNKIDITFHFSSEALASMHTRLPNVVKTGKTTTRVRAGNMQEAFDAYCSSGLIACVDWLNNPNVHKSCRK